MSSCHSTIVVPEDVSHLHSHTSGPTNLHSIRLVLPKHPFDHDTAWVKQLQPRQHSSNKYLSFGSLGCRATATRMWISHFAGPSQCSELGWDAGAEQQCSERSRPFLGTADILLPPLIVWPWAGGSYVCWAESSIFLIYQLEIVTVPLIGHTTQSSADANDGHNALVFITWAPCPSHILCLFQNFTPAPGSFSVFSLPSFPNTGKKGCPLA